VLKGCEWTTYEANMMDGVFQLLRESLFSARTTIIFKVERHKL
jgi:hypothetical protein